MRVKLVVFDDLLDDIFGKDTMSRKAFNHRVFEAFTKQAKALTAGVEDKKTPIALGFGSFFKDIMRKYRRDIEAREKLEKEQLENTTYKSKIGKYFKKNRNIYYCNDIKAFTDGDVQVSTGDGIKQYFFPYNECVWEKETSK